MILIHLTNKEAFLGMRKNFTERMVKVTFEVKVKIRSISNFTLKIIGLYILLIEQFVTVAN